jgi:hypothetical protein
VRNMTRYALCIVAISLLFASRAAAASICIGCLNISVDEYGGQTCLQQNGSLMDDRLEFQLPVELPSGPGGSVGYVALCDVAVIGNEECYTSDVIRFTDPSDNSDLGRLIFYSLDSDGELADELPPSDAHIDIFLPEFGNDVTSAVAVYTPESGDPGYFVEDGKTPTYTFVSEGHVAPEPTSMTLLGVGLVGLAVRMRRRRRRVS